MNKESLLKLGPWVILLLLIGGLISQRVVILDLNSKITALSIDLKTCNSNENDLKTAITNQNKDLEKFKYDVIEMEAQKTQLENKLKENVAIRATEIERILKQDVPKTCEKTVQHLREAVKGLKQW
jgi:chromosome segregation ATPase